MSIASLAIKALVFKAKAFEKATKDPLTYQKEVLAEYVSRNRFTEYGLKYNFAGIRSIVDYQRIVPMSDCATLRPYVERIEKGRANILTKDEVIFFGITSGTTDIPKLIPVTEYSRKKKFEIQELWVYYIVRDHPGVLDGKIFAIISPEVEGVTESGIPYGAESGHGYRYLPLAVRCLYALPPQVFNITDYEARYYCMLRIAMQENITTLATLNPSTIILLCQKIAEWKHLIIDDIKNGTLNARFDIAKATRKSIGMYLMPDKKRAGELKSILNEKKDLLPKYFWPNMKLIECWKSGMSKLYLKELPAYFGDTPIRDFGCLSTEARSSIPMSDCGAGGVLAIKTNFYEFMPKEDADNSVKNFLLCDELEKGKEYYLIVTTPGGLYRYNIDDIVRVDGFFNKTPLIEFVQKGLCASSLAGEKLYESHIIEAVNQAVEKNGIVARFFSSSIQFDNPARYIFLMEFNGDVPRDKKRSLLEDIETGLYRQNAEYKEKRLQQLLGPPILKVVKRGDFEKYRAKKINEGAHDSQFKVPELNPDMDFQKNFAIEEEIHFKSGRH